MLRHFAEAVQMGAFGVTLRRQVAGRRDYCAVAPGRGDAADKAITAHAVPAVEIN